MSKRYEFELEGLNLIINQRERETERDRETETKRQREISYFNMLNNLVFFWSFRDLTVISKNTFYVNVFNFRLIFNSLKNNDYSRPSSYQVNKISANTNEISLDGMIH